MSLTVLDTDVASRLYNGTLPVDVEAKLNDLELLLTFITVGEMLRGAYRASWGPARVSRLEQWLALLPVLESAPLVSRTWARLVAEAENKGRPIGVNDSWIAACTISAECSLTTLNRRHFENIASLELL